MLYLIAYMLLEPVKRALSAVLYPAVYPLRRNVRDDSALIWPRYLLRPRPWCIFLWLFLDDSIYIETKHDCAKQDDKYPAFILRCGWTWLRCYWWSAIRNSMVNWNNLNAYCLGTFIDEKKLFESSDGKNFYAVNTYTNGNRPYIEFWVFGRWNQVGWLKGSSRFEIDILKRK